ncbi:MAG: MBL fold metallo-hydrolase [Candidatus Hadarchaeum sp.]|uniref:MBL fold metallo-hydrolase n=1 Tax=Candidatus Hadarchaeum sp. TaxID=2883567 RepID=UPI003170F128
MVTVVFLGSGGGRFQMVGQYFKTGGFRIHTGVKVHVDPGPGALLLTHQYGLSPLDLDGIVVTHCHPDHYTDTEVLIEAMTKHSTKKRGSLICSRSVIDGVGDYGPAVSRYHQRKPEKLLIPNNGEKIQLNDLELEAVPAKHSDPTTFGIIFHTDDGAIGYTSDTQYFEEIARYYDGIRILIANVTRPLSMRIPWHLCSEDLIKILTEVKPELAVMIHMGMMFLKHEPQSEAERIKSETGVETIPGQVGLRVDMNDKIKITRPKKQPTLDEFARPKLENFVGAE